MFWLVKFLEDVKWDGMRHFDAHAYRTEDYEGVKDFARGCIRTYLILKEKAEQFNQHAEIQAILAEIEATKSNFEIGDFESLKSANFDRSEIASKGLKYERLDQLTMDIIYGVA